MCRDKRCGNCEHFKNADEYGYGVCEQGNRMYPSLENKGCDLHRIKNGWTGITPDNVDELYPIKEELLMIAFKLCDKIYYQQKSLMLSKLEEMADLGGYYYYVLPELKI